MTLPLLNDAHLNGQKVLVRADFNVPLDGGRVTDDSRIKETLPTIQLLLAQNCRVILCSHLGRPNGKVIEELRLGPVAKRLSELLDKDVEYVTDCIGAEAEEAAGAMQPGDVLLLENLRFHPEEEANDEHFARQLASLADAYVNDAFGASHRAHASVAGVTKHLPSYAGLLLEKEVVTLTKMLDNPEKPFIAILGGAKVSDKIGVIKNLLPKVDKLLIGGAMMFTFLKAQGKEVGRSLVEDDQLELANELFSSGKIVLPTDVAIAHSRDDTAGVEVVSCDEIPASHMGLDIGPQSIELFGKELSGAKTIIWNGPLGLFEVDAFSKGTVEIAAAVAHSGATTVIGGGDTLAAAEKARVSDRITHVSTGGGAMLELLEGKKLPAIAALEESAS